MDGTAGSYTAGTGISIANDEISVDSTVVALKSDLGDELPPIASGDAGKVLKVNAGETAVEWANDASQTYTGGTGIDITNNVISVDNTIATKSELFSGDYDDLTNKPDLSVYAESSDLATVATTGDYDDLTNKPTIPAALSAGTGIDITSNVVSIDNTVALKSDIPATTKIIEVDLKNNRTEVDMSSLSADDNTYIVNAMTNGFEDYPFVVKATYSNGSSQYAVFTVKDAGSRFGISNVYYYFNLECNEFYYGSGGKRLFIRSNETSPYTIQGITITDSYLVSQLANKQDTLTAGTNITISGNTISATVPQELPSITSGDAGKVLKVNSGETGVEWDSAGSSYTSGNGIDISNNEVSVLANSNMFSFDNGVLCLNTQWLYDFVEGIINPTPVLTDIWLGYGDEPNVVDMVDIHNAEITGNGPDPNGCWHFEVENITLPEAVDNQIDYGFNMNGTFQTSGGGMPSWVSDEYVDGWVWNMGPAEVWLLMSSSSSTSATLQITYDPNWQPSPSSAPDLNTLNISYSNVDMVDIDNASIGGSVMNNKYMWDIEGITLPEAFQAQGYGYNFVAGDIQTSGGGTAFWVDETDFHAWIIENGPLTIMILPQSGLNANIHVEFDPNWQPPVSNVPNLTGFQLGHTLDGDMVDMSSLEVSGFTPPDGKYHWQLNSVNFGTAIIENDSYLFLASTDDGPSGSTMGASANAEWVNDGVGLGWAFHPSNSPLYEVFISVSAQSDTIGNIEVIQDPNWTPSN